MTHHKKYSHLAWQLAKLSIFLYASIFFLVIYLCLNSNNCNFFAILPKIKNQGNTVLNLMEGSAVTAKQFHKSDKGNEIIFHKSKVSSFQMFISNRNKEERSGTVTQFANEETIDSASYSSIYPHPFQFLINEKDKCKQKTPFLVLLIATKADEKQCREAIRKTWGNESVVPGIKIVRLFMLGFSDKDQNENILQESRKYHDIIQQDFLDTYNNLTLKTMMGIKWIATYCNGTSFIMKTDSDVFVNTIYLIQEVLRPIKSPSQYFFTGCLMKNHEPIRNPNSKWYMPEELYPGDRYPDFCSGTGYVFSRAVVPKIVSASLKVKYVHLEDIYVALCLERQGITISPPLKPSFFNIYKVPFFTCLYSNIITSHGIDPTEQIIFWQTLQKEKHMCHK
ncbi:PREDICTED: beta-1,3-galactosyltransferase 2-like [Gavialis gangeticus]|uniref:beta-1,3-galactosyltransferase 2-like n=1 Tax=Gavialis gangeticus TaxID=94835 RepID=UPI00092E474C|nr:PREDICTED: beta-1,3-galactosyltransferase 2-like [Gavialis gangeticus]